METRKKTAEIQSRLKVSIPGLRWHCVALQAWKNPYMRDRAERISR
jgi:hypothetical protein